eukprot:1196392-Prorocentrum_minimum.AAC.2
MPALVEIFGVDRAMEMAVNNPNLLSSRTIQAAVPALVEVLGKEGARVALQRNAQLLRVRAETIHAAMATLVELMGGKAATQVVHTNSSLLMTRSETILGCFLQWATCCSASLLHVVTSDAPICLACLTLHLMSTGQDAMPVLVEVLGAEAAAIAVQRNPGLLGSRAVTLKGAIAALKEVLGPAEALRVVSENPFMIKEEVKGCSNNTNEATTSPA